MIVHQHDRRDMWKSSIQGTRGKSALNLTNVASVEFHSHRNMPVPTPRSNSDVACSDWCAESVTFHRAPIFVSREVLNIKNKKCLKLPRSHWHTIVSCNFCAILSPQCSLPHAKDGFYSGFHSMDSGLELLDSEFFESRTRIPDSSR